MSNTDLFWEIFVHIGNALSIIYNIPQIYLTWKTKKANDISFSFLWMRIGSSVIWIGYSINYKLWIVIVSWVISFISSAFILYYVLKQNFFLKKNILGKASAIKQELGH